MASTNLGNHVNNGEFSKINDKYKKAVMLKEHVHTKKTIIKVLLKKQTSYMTIYKKKT